MSITLSEDIDQKTFAAETRSNMLAPRLRFKGFEENWLTMKLEEVTEKIQDGTHFSPKQKDQGNYKYITSKNIRNGYMDFKDVMFLDDDAHREIYKRCDVKFNDILLTKDGASTGAACLNELHEEFSLLSSVAFLRANKNLATNSFLYQIISGPKGQQEIQASIAGQAITRITLSKIKNFKFFFPTLPEQKKIASFLSAVDEKIQQLTRKKELLEQYKKGVMQNLFSGKLRFKPAQSEVEGDDNGKDFPDWEEKRLGEIGKFYAGGDLDKLDYRKEKAAEYIYPIYANGAGQGLYGYATTFQFAPNCVTVSGRGNLGYANVRNQNFNAIVRLIVIEPKQYISSKYLEEIINNINFVVESTGVPQLTVPQISSYKIIIPCLEEQQKIATYLSSIDTKIESVANQITQTQTFKKGLLQQMFV